MSETFFSDHAQAIAVGVLILFFAGRDFVNRKAKAVQDAERLRKWEWRIQGWHVGQLIVVCATLVVGAVTLGMVSDHGLALFGGDLTAFILLVVAVLADLRLTWVWFEGRKRPPQAGS